MVNIATWAFILYQVAFITDASMQINDIESSGEYDYEYKEEEIETVTESSRMHSPIPRSRVLFDEDENSDSISFENPKKYRITRFNNPKILSGKIESINFESSTESRKVRFRDPNIVSEKHEMTLREMNEIFNKKKHIKNKKRKHNTQSEKKKVRQCMEKNLLFSSKDNQCHEPTSKGPCKNNRWIVAVKGKLEGFCKRNLCTNEETPIMFNGTCSPIYGKCPKSSRLYLNKKGVGFCDCDEGFSLNMMDGACYKEHTQGPCRHTQTWIQRRRIPRNLKTDHRAIGRCTENKCGYGEVQWKDNGCYKVDTDDMFDMCVASEEGELFLENEILTCKMSHHGRSVILGAGRSCRRGRAWSSYRNRCVRVYSRG